MSERQSEKGEQINLGKEKKGYTLAALLIKKGNGNPSHKGGEKT